MTLQGWLQIVVFLAVLTALTPVIGGYMARVYANEPVALARVLGPLERALYRLMRTDPAREQDWKSYARTAIVFSLVSWMALYLILRTQGIHPFNPQGYRSGTWDVSFTTASSCCGPSAHRVRRDSSGNGPGPRPRRRIRRSSRSSTSRSLASRS
jgi:K+-transporting ATPase ATPase A chain